MTQSMLGLAGTAMLVAAALWLSLRMAATSDLHMLPVSCRRRLTWWRVNSRVVYLLCGALVAAAAIAQLPHTMS